MAQSRVILGMLLVGIGITTASPALRAAHQEQAATPPIPPRFEVQLLGEGVYGAIRQEPPGLAVDANSVFIVNDADVVVIDTNDSPTSARAVIQAIRRITPKPVRYVVNTHWHDDHILGNQAYRDAFPGVEFIASAAMHDYLPTQGVENRKTMVSGATDFRRMLRDNLAKNQSFLGGPLSDSERAANESDIAIVDRYLAEMPSAQIVQPTIAVQDRLTIYRGSHTIDIRFIGRGHTHGDLIVHLPKQNIVVAGDLVVAPVPLIGADQSFVGDWSKTLDTLLSLKPAVIVPGHGPVLHDDAYVRLFGRFLTSVKQQADAAIARGETLDQARKSVNVDEFKKAMAGDDRELQLLFASYAKAPAIGAVYREAGKK